jgi:uncharacterized protein YodC (DUF2158 family)
LGEARRRKLTGSYPNLADPVAAARRFWSEQGTTPVEDFVAPVGTIAITFDVEGIAPSTWQRHWTTPLPASAPGYKAKLRNGGPVMTVACVSDDPLRSGRDCAWIARGALHRRGSPPSCWSRCGHPGADGGR